MKARREEISDKFLAAMACLRGSKFQRRWLSGLKTIQAAMACLRWKKFQWRWHVGVEENSSGDGMSALKKIPAAMACLRDGTFQRRRDMIEEQINPVAIDWEWVPDRLIFCERKRVPRTRTPPLQPRCLRCYEERCEVWVRWFPHVDQGTLTCQQRVKG